MPPDLIFYHISDSNGKMTSDDFPSDGSPLDFFDREDALAIKWYHGANSLAQMNEALEGDYMM